MGALPKEPKKKGGVNAFLWSGRDRRKFDVFTSRLISIVSHELKSPLAVIKGYAALLRDGTYGKLGERAKEAVIKIEGAADDAVELVANMIDFHKAGEGKMEYEFSRTDLVGLAKDVAEGLRILAEGKKLMMTFAASARDIFVNADPRELKHVIQNLVDNAIKYTEKGFIRVEVKSGNGVAVFSVADSGIGIAGGANPLFFREFIRDERVNNKIKGSGIGLYVAKSIIDAHGGKIWMESAGEGRGSTFGFSLPAVK